MHLSPVPAYSNVKVDADGFRITMAELASERI